ncbi:MAG: hypothetical protein JXQ73_31995 [Phycisphaerae bacterium]|nr:hypothetical protein [Phycisphaerae bacterium]
MKKSHLHRITRGVAALAAGSMFLQMGGCTVDDDLFAELLNLTVQVVLDSVLAA